MYLKHVLSMLVAEKYPEVMKCPGKFNTSPILCSWSISIHSVLHRAKEVKQRFRSLKITQSVYGR